MCTKEQYIERSKDFIVWFSDLIRNWDFEHNYVTSSPILNNDWIAFNCGETQWKCTSLEDAYIQYYWKANNVKTTDIIKKLEGMIQADYRINDQEKLLISCMAIMGWGGVLSNNNKTLFKLYRNGSLKTMLERSLNTLKSSDPDLSCFNNNQDDACYMTSGYSKIISLLDSNFVIYDSRVAAALGMIVNIFCDEYKLNKIPGHLDFVIPSQKNDKTNRLPEGFKRLAGYNMHKRYAKWMLRLSWLLGEVVKELNNNGHEFAGLKGKPKQMRAIEMSLFMLGYDIGNN